MRSLQVLVGAAIVAVSASMQAQEPTPRPQRPERAPNIETRVVRLFGGDENRAALGIGTGSAGKRDTLGLLIESITPGGPADQAGLQEGNRIAAIEGVNLALAPADAGEPDMDGLMTRRLVRELGKVKPGDDVELKVWADGRMKTVKVKTVAFRDLADGWERQSREELDDRPAIGLGFGGGSVRDTLGLLVTSIASGGPAEKAGLEEGNRIQAIDGVDVRVPSSEADGGRLVSAKIRRFTDALRKHKAGDEVELKVYADGRTKTMKVKTARSADVYPNQGRGFHFEFGGDGMAPMPPTPPMPPMPPVQEMMRMPRLWMQMDGDIDARVREQMRASEGRMRAAMMKAERAARTARVDAVRAVRLSPMAWSDAPLYVRAPGYLFVSNGLGDEYGVSMRGLRLTSVTDDLASYFGKGSAGGLLVLESRAPWTALRPGDVILSVNGTPVHDGDRTRIVLDRGKMNEVEVLRKGKKLIVKVGG